MDLDRDIYRWINGRVGEFPLLDALVRLVVNEYFVPVGLALGLLFLWFGGREGTDRERWQRAVLTACLAVGTANAVVKIVNVLWFRERPFQGRIVDLLFYKPIDSSFPSNGTAVGFAIATAVWLYDRRMSSLFWVLASLFALARLFAGVHFPSDIVGGAVLGVLSALAAQWAMHRLEPVMSRLVAALRSLGVA